MPANKNIYTVKIYIKWLNLLPIDMVESAEDAEKPFQGLKASETSQELYRLALEQTSAQKKKKKSVFAFSYLALWFAVPAIPQKHNLHFKDNPRKDSSVCSSPKQIHNPTPLWQNTLKDNILSRNKTAWEYQIVLYSYWKLSSSTEPL